MEDDLRFLEDLLHLPDGWDHVQDIFKVHQEQERNMVKKERTVINQSKQDYSYAEYMSYLQPWELKVLYKLHEIDFKVFNYDPCEGLQ